MTDEEPRSIWAIWLERIMIAGVLYWFIGGTYHYYSRQPVVGKCYALEERADWNNDLPEKVFVTSHPRAYPGDINYCWPPDPFVSIGSHHFEVNYAEIACPRTVYDECAKAYMRAGRTR